MISRASEDEILVSAIYACLLREADYSSLVGGPFYAATGYGARYVHSQANRCRLVNQSCSSMLSNRVSWFFDMRGPSLTVDTASCLPVPSLRRIQDGELLFKDSSTNDC